MHMHTICTGCRKQFSWYGKPEDDVKCPYCGKVHKNHPDDIKAINDFKKLLAKERKMILNLQCYVCHHKFTHECEANEVREIVCPNCTNDKVLRDDDLDMIDTFGNTIKTFDQQLEFEDDS